MNHFVVYTEMANFVVYRPYRRTHPLFEKHSCEVNTTWHVPVTRPVQNMESRRLLDVGVFSREHSVSGVVETRDQFP